ncbi:protein RD3-like [Cyprinodon tularosa]|uniref:Retinal degeneration 3 like n=1 Tax=Cyprinodon variegatus TaxID=28743 RepID=A0A3Q2DVP9_CYPVA|nr:PREDICTED: protein RD3-like [Cyprinodon variegatus]XP_038142114.1 protein RD3-like [Cyprinodon tularosa]
MPLFSWMKWLHQTKAQTEESLNRTEVVPSHMLLAELLWHIEERERLARQLERENRLAHSALGLRWFQKHPRLQTLLSSSELHQLEFLCSQVPQIHTATVISRFREVLGTNDVRPWELASVFKHILIDFLNQREYSEEDSLSMAVWRSQCERQCFVTPITPQWGGQQREEIPTVSGYVDRAMRHSTSFTPSGVWDLPYYYPGPRRPKGESTTL